MHVTRFCLICNYVTRIIEPLASRCAKFRFKSLSAESMMTRMNHIAGILPLPPTYYAFYNLIRLVRFLHIASEAVNLEPDAMQAILIACEGDMRKAVTYLQSAHQLCAGSAVSAAMIFDLTARVPETVLASLWTALASGSLDILTGVVSDIMYEGFPMSSILPKLHDGVVEHASLSGIDKALICDKMAQVEQCLIDGSSEYLQFLDLAAFILRRFSGLNFNIDAVTVF